MKEKNKPSASSQLDIRKYRYYNENNLLIILLSANDFTQPRQLNFIITPTSKKGKLSNKERKAKILKSSTVYIKLKYTSLLNTLQNLNEPRA